ncbi:Phage terminase-like protein, large subunit [Liquorilactobacillus aquaticus DSM 21051]|uniref:Phage terminase-like protein, large subunit n=1 Tax=Liquorilactobacillus aquaticus DSM 21051 TaxID=1423725 RepID=A0A0R2CVX1_9LACO|nr:terminase TerL endonuclease subunit [Liquorilactobacillus aquaticus]KRM95966.1 Phage terminase-like protein, large subunit [Liquorilactobacillus aquaticus DSM 21051]
MQKFDFTGVSDIKEKLMPFKETFKELLKKYSDSATKYAYDVIFANKFITCRDTKLACIRHLNDLMRIGNKDFSYHYDLDAVSAIEYFTRLLPNPDKLDENIEPQLWQSFILDSLIGWRSDTNGTRFTDANISVARQQGKTWLASMLVNFYYFVVCQGASSQDFLIASYDSEHATKLFNDVAIQAKKLVKIDDFSDWVKENDVEVQAYQIIGKENKNTVRKGTSQGGGFDSFHNAIAVYDEIGNLKPALNETLRQITSGQNGINNRLFLKISTAYPDIKVKFKSDQDVMRSMIEQDFKRDGDDTFQVLYNQDSENEVYEPETWAKSNPLLNEYPEEKAKLLLDALIKDRDKNEREGTLETFVNKSLNLWSRRFQNSFLSLDNIRKNIIDSFDIEGRDVYIGFDGSQTNDNSSLGMEFPYIDGQKRMFYAMQHSFIPFAQAKTIEAKSKQDGLNYRELERLGFVSITNLPSGVINKDQIYQWLVDFVVSHRLKVKAIIADPNLASWFVNKITNYNPEWTILTLAPTSYNLSNSTKDFQNSFINGNIKILNDPLLIDGLNNAVLKEDKGGAVKIDRVNRTNDHIDTTDALINGHSQAQNYFENFHDESYNFMNDLSREQRKKTWATIFGLKGGG